MSAATIRNEETDRLLQVLSEMTDPEQIYDLLADLCTPREINDMSQRLQIARLLSKGESYTAIAKATGASDTTIARVSRCLNYGSNGYEHALSILEGQN